MGKKRDEGQFLLFRAASAIASCMSLTDARQTYWKPCHGNGASTETYFSEIAYFFVDRFLVRPKSTANRPCYALPSSCALSLFLSRPAGSQRAYLMSFICFTCSLLGEESNAVVHVTCPCAPVARCFVLFKLLTFLRDCTVCLLQC